MIDNIISSISSAKSPFLALLLLFAFVVAGFFSYLSSMGKSKHKQVEALIEAFTSEQKQAREDFSVITKQQNVIVMNHLAHVGETLLKLDLTVEANTKTQEKVYELLQNIRAEGVRRKT